MKTVFSLLGALLCLAAPAAPAYFPGTGSCLNVMEDAGVAIVALAAIMDRDHLLQLPSSRSRKMPAVARRRLAGDVFESTIEMGQ